MYFFCFLSLKAFRLLRLRDTKADIFISARQMENVLKCYEKVKSKNMKDVLIRTRSSKKERRTKGFFGTRTSVILSKIFIIISRRTLFSISCYLFFLINPNRKTMNILIFRLLFFGKSWKA